MGILELVKELARKLGVPPHRVLMALAKLQVDEAAGLHPWRIA